MKRCIAALSVASTVVATAGILVASSTAASADQTALPISYAAAAKVTPGAGLSPVLTTSGALGGLLDFLTPVLNQVVTPLTTQLTSLPSTLIADIVGGLTGAGFVANSPTSAQSPPASGFPSCGSNGWTSDDCFGPAVPGISAAPLLSLGSGTLQGYAAADSTGGYAAAQSADPVLSLLGVTIGDLGVATSGAQCLTSTLVCTGTSGLTSVKLLNGAVALKTDSTGTLTVSLNSSAFLALSAFTSPTTLTGAGVTATAQSQGGMLRVSISLSLDNLLTALGIADVLSSLGASDSGSAVTLTLNLGAGTSVSGGTAKAWGLEVGAGLSANVSISVLGLISVGVSAPDTSTTGDLFDLQLGYAAAANAATTNPSGAPPQLT